MKARTAWRWLTSFCVVALLVGCGQDRADEPGIAATVNGIPLSVAELEARHDLRRIGLPETANPTVRQLQAQFGAVLADMIVAKLAGQELAARHEAVTEAEVAAAEAAVRADYSGDAFAARLLEEHIDLDRWRAALRDRLTVAKFCEKVLRPKLRVGVTEAADYYKAHIADFTRPERTRFLLVRAKTAEPLRAAVAAYGRSGARSDLEGRAGLAVQEVSLADRNLPGPWREALRALAPGAASPVLPDDGGRAVLVLLEHQGETVRDPAEAYAAVEGILAGAKLEAAFAEWVRKAVAQATIRVNPRLTEATRPESAPAATPAQVATAPAAPPADAPQGDPDSGHPGAANVPSAPAAAGDQPAPPVGAAERPEPAPTAAGPAPEPTASPDSPAPSAPTPATPDAPAPEPSPAEPSPAPAAPVAPPQPGPEAGGHVTFVAIKASWILYTVDEEPEQRQYLKPGKPLDLAFKKRLFVRLGTPSEVSYRFGDREERVEVRKKETKTLEFP